MATVVIQRYEDPGTHPSVIFEEIERRLNEVRCRAYELFESRGREVGRDVDDWLQAEREVMGQSTAALSEKDGAIELELELPSYKPSEVEVTATADEVVIHAESKQESSNEIRSSEIFRRFVLPEPIDVEQAKATLEEGVLRISAAKASRTESYPVQVQAA